MYGKERIEIDEIKRCGDNIVIGYDNKTRHAWISKNSEHWVKGGIMRLFNSNGKKGVLIRKINENLDVVQININGRAIFNDAKRPEGEIKLFISPLVLANV